ncbi:AP-1 complex subunit beta-1 [Galemys pyrenaicus]|uniref:AP-1 complex subunit beta-1 n=1 Tax=Galemys pyrenaicus TaxID=202257 RepID=A0A8J6A4X8_GALPY|nr:AP-1 complex subunit beta-1 [Galemys pyrenaicus]
MAIVAINSFMKDCEDTNPLGRIESWGTSRTLITDDSPDESTKIAISNHNPKDDQKSQNSCEEFGHNDLLGIPSHQVLAELKEYATEADIDFVCKAAQRNMPQRQTLTLFAKPRRLLAGTSSENTLSKYESIIATLCENLYSLMSQMLKRQILLNPLLDEVICHIGFLAQIYLKSFNAFVQGSNLLEILLNLDLSLPSQCTIGIFSANGTVAHLRRGPDTLMGQSLFNKNSFGVISSTPLVIHTPLISNQGIDVSLTLDTLDLVIKMEPLNNLQLLYPIQSDFCRRWQNGVPDLFCNVEGYSQLNELHFEIKECNLNADTISSNCKTTMFILLPRGMWKGRTCCSNP